MAKPPKLTPERYFPCRNCGQWRREHAGKERKCLFQASRFEPKFPAEITSLEREALLGRLETLDRQLVGRLHKKADDNEQEIGKIHDVAASCCEHVNDEGMGLLERRLAPEKDKYHIICSLCGEDWYEDEEGKKLHPEGVAGSGE
jgi:hypothetical protein